MKTENVNKNGNINKQKLKIHQMKSKQINNPDDSNKKKMATPHKKKKKK